MLQTCKSWSCVLFTLLALTNPSAVTRFMYSTAGWAVLGEQCWESSAYADRYHECACLLTSSVTRWLDYCFNIWTDTTMKICTMAYKICPVGSKFCQILYKPAKNCQSGIISPIPVNLLLRSIKRNHQKVVWQRVDTVSCAHNEDNKLTHFVSTLAYSR